MHVVKYLAAPWAAFIFYAVASFLAGNVGLFAFHTYEKEREMQLVNLEELRGLNSGLKAQKEALNSDPDTIAREALNIGYGRDGESYIMIEGFHDGREQRFRAGEIIKGNVPDAVEDESLKMYAIGIFIIVLGTLGVTDVLRFIKNA
ncbi:MAG: septum formation initiator family protein [Spirochaetaceae bacterium]|jgi:cell division protein FtsB|nr:septum formation initiator family protein [Spirochaetaceae bacterium]